jgi:uncharacterized protein (DUF433 family)
MNKPPRLENSAKVEIDPEILGGCAVFVNTRVPIDGVLASIDRGIDGQRLQRAYPFLTPAHIEAARAWVKAHPQVPTRRLNAAGRPIVSRRIIR